jgi:hypothetical protein
MADIVLYTSSVGVDLRLSGWQEICSMPCIPVKRPQLTGGDRENSNVALKIINVDADTREMQILHHLRTSSIALDNVSHPGRNAVVHLLDDFNLGTSHKGLVLDVMGTDVQSRADAQHGHRLTRKTAGSVARQVALGLDYLWKCSVAHGGEYLPRPLRRLLTMLI